VLAGLVVMVAGAAVLVACGGSSGSGPGAQAARRTTTTTRRGAASPCGAARPAPRRYESVVVFSFENRRWRDVGPGFGPAMPYLHRLGARCSWFPRWTETAPGQSSLAQYVGQVTGAAQPGTVDDCSPSVTCSTRADNLFRQVRRSGRRAVDYVEGAQGPCRADGNAARHVPPLYLWGADDRDACRQEVRPLTELDPARLPAFAFVTPTLCHDGHDCGNAVVDAWARVHVQPVLDSAAYRAGRVAVFVWYDEDAPVPNLWIAPTARAGARAVEGAGASATLRAWESMLGLPCLADACDAVDLRAPARV
jgi:hypothetical protein